MFSVEQLFLHDSYQRHITVTFTERNIGAPCFKVKEGMKPAWKLFMMSDLIIRMDLNDGNCFLLRGDLWCIRRHQSCLNAQGRLI